MVSFTTTFVAAISILSIAQPIMAGGVVKTAVGLLTGQKRSVDGARFIEARAGKGWPFDSHGTGKVAARDDGIVGQIESCLNNAAGALDVTKEGTGSYKIAFPGSKPPPQCVSVVQKYAQTPMADGKVVDNPDSSITYTPIAKFKAEMDTLVKHTGAGGAANGAAAPATGAKGAAPAAGAAHGAGHGAGH